MQHRCIVFGSGRVKLSYSKRLITELNYRAITYIRLYFCVFTLEKNGVRITQLSINIHSSLNKCLYLSLIIRPTGFTTCYFKQKEKVYHWSIINDVQLLFFANYKRGEDVESCVE